MTPLPDPRAPESPPPLGSWPRCYALACGLAVLTIALLWLLTVAFDYRGTR